MSTTTTATGRPGGVADGRRHRTPAQWLCLIGGSALVLAGLLGFIADSSFDTGSTGTSSELQGDEFLGLEVNGWHNIVHLLSGLFLLSMAKKRKTAKTAALVFGVTYALVTVIGMIDGDDVFGLFPVNPADNVLHLVLAAAALAAAFGSRADDDVHAGPRTTSGGEGSGRMGRGRFDRSSRETAATEHGETTGRR